MVVADGSGDFCIARIAEQAGTHSSYGAAA
jgi:hypothetical protein